MNGLPVLLAEALPALAVFLWMEASVFLDMITKAFKPATLAGGIRTRRFIFDESFDDK